MVTVDNRLAQRFERLKLSANKQADIIEALKDDKTNYRYTRAERKYKELVAELEAIQLEVMAAEKRANPVSVDIQVPVKRFQTKAHAPEQG